MTQTEINRALEELTPGGSEFHGDPKRCLRWIKDRMSGPFVAVKQERDKLAAELAESNEWVTFWHDERDELFRLLTESRKREGDARTLNIKLGAVMKGIEDGAQELLEDRDKLRQERDQLASRSAEWAAKATEEAEENKPLRERIKALEEKLMQLEHDNVRMRDLIVRG